MYTNNSIELIETTINHITTSIVRPKEKREKETLYPTIFYYHGWSSHRKNQEFIGYILATLGYQVIIPDAPFHGDRGQLDYDKDGQEYFSKVVEGIIEEFPTLKMHMLYGYDADPFRVGIMGHSMGSIAASGIFMEDPQLKTAVLFDGSNAWEHTFLEMYQNTKGLSEGMLQKDPVKNLKKLDYRPVLLFHGQEDSFLPISSQIHFTEEAHKIPEGENVVLVDIPNLNHYITVNGFEAAVDWLEHHLL